MRCISALPLSRFRIEGYRPDSSEIRRKALSSRGEGRPRARTGVRGVLRFLSYWIMEKMGYPIRWQPADDAELEARYVPSRLARIRSSRTTGVHPRRVALHARRRPPPTAADDNTPSTVALAHLFTCSLAATSSRRRSGHRGHPASRRTHNRDGFGGADGASPMALRGHDRRRAGDRHRGAARGLAPAGRGP